MHCDFHCAQNLLNCFSLLLMHTFPRDGHGGIVNSPLFITVVFERHRFFLFLTRTLLLSDLQWVPGIESESGSSDMRISCISHYAISMALLYKNL